LKAQGNEFTSPAGFVHDRDGYGRYCFTKPLDMTALQAQFDLLVSILPTKDTVQDTHNLMTITQRLGTQPALSFTL
jgi:hypothetical protein